MTLQILNPIEIPEWESLLLHSENHSIFHTSAWARVLESTYRFKPIYFVYFERGQIVFLLPMMEVKSPLIGKRGVSLPFTDQCRPHVLQREFLPEAFRNVIAHGEESRWKYIDWRDGKFFDDGLAPWETYYTHDIDLDKSESALFSALTDSNRRNIKKAVREGVTIKIDQSFDSLTSFYRLNCITRKRHGLPPQPFLFFKNIFRYVISKDYGTVVTASYKESVIAAAVFLHFGRNVLFKYGASEMKHQNLRPNNLVLWEAIKWYNQKGLATMNLGRTEDDNLGLLRYKQAWGASESLLKYFRYNIRKKTYVQKRNSGGDLHKKIFGRMPTVVLRGISHLFYKYAG